jgi:outer membrane immunogenic protein
MDRIFSTAVVLALVGAAGSANGADMSRPSVAPPYIVPAYNWTGIYFGGNIGGAWAHTTLNDSFTGFQIGNSASGVVGGSQLGFNYQTGNLVIGAEWMFEGTSLSSTHTVAGLQGTVSNNWLTTLAGRFGWAANNWLYYGKAGGGWTDISATLTNLANGTQVSRSNTNAGWLLGAGIEYGFAPNWTVKVEYDYLGLNTWNANSTIFAPNADRFSVNPNVQTFTMGFNYKF